MPETSEKEGYALFDLDHTILPFDTQVFFANFVLQREGWRRIYLLWFIPALPLAAIKLLDLRKMKRLFSSYLWKMPRKKLEQYVSEFLESEFSDALYPEVVAEIERHRQEGRTLILNSASPEFYVKEIAAKLGFDHYIGTNLIVEDPMPFLPQIEGPNNKHGEKIVTMRDRGFIPPNSKSYPTVGPTPTVPLTSPCYQSPKMG